MKHKNINFMIGIFLSSSLLISYLYGDNNYSYNQLSILKSQANLNVSNDNKQQLYEEIQAQYEQLSLYLETGVLFNKLKEESQNYSKAINSDYFTDFSREYNKFLNILKTFEKQVASENKSTVNDLISQLEGNDLSSETDLKSIADIFADGQLNQTEICQQIQIKLQVLTSQNDPDCGNFDQQTYTALTSFLERQNQLIKINLDELAKLVETAKIEFVANNSNNSRETTTSNNKLPFILSSVAILLGLISLAIALISYLTLQKFINYQKKIRNNIATNSQKINNLENKIENYNQQIEIFNRNLSDFQNSVNTQSSRLKELEFRKGENNLNPNTDSKTASHNVHLPSPKPLKSTPDSPLPENILLAQSYQENPANLLRNAIQVGMTKDTTNKILGGVWEQIYLEKNRRTGEYFIVTSNNGEMYLFLNPNCMFNPQTLSTIHKSQLFICRGNLSQSRKGIDITIEKPARVKKEAQYWVLVESGEIILE